MYQPEFRKKEGYITMRFLSEFLLVLLIVSLVGCQTPQQVPPSPMLADATATVEKQATNTASPPPTSTATETVIPTVTPFPPTSSIRVVVDDLPKGFVEVPQGMLETNALNISGQKFSNENLFLFTHSDQFKLFFGFSTLLSSAEDKANFQKILENPNEAVEAFANFYKAENITLNPTPPQVVEIGDARTNASATLELSDDFSVVLDMVAFQNGETGIYLLNIYSLHIDMGKILPNLATKLSEQITTGGDKGIAFDGLDSQDMSAAWIEPSAWILDAYKTNAFEANIYEPTTLEAMGISDEEFNNLELECDSLFAYTGSSKDTHLLGCVRYLDSYEDIGMVDTHINDVDILLNKFSSMMGVEKFESHDFIYYMNYGLYDIISGRTMRAKINTHTYQFEAINARVNNINIILFTSRLVPNNYKSVLITDTLERFQNLINFTEDLRKSPPPIRLLSDEEIKAIPMPEVEENPAPVPSTPINLHALLPEFLEIPKYTLDFKTEDISGQIFSNYDPFLFVGKGEHEAQYIYGFTTLLETDNDKENFDILLKNPNQAVEAFATFYGATVDYAGTGKLYQELGDAQANTHIILVVNRRTLPHLDMIAFRKGVIGVYALFKYSEHSPGIPAFPDFPNAIAEKLPQDSTIELPQPSQSLDPYYRFRIDENPLTDWLEIGPWYVSKGFTRVSLDEIGISQERWDKAGFQENSLFVYQNVEKEKMIIEYNYFFQTYEEIGVFNIARDPSVDLEKIINLLNGKIIQEYERPEGAIEDEDLRSMLVEIDKKTYVAEIIKKRAENIGFIYFTLQLPYNGNIRNSLTINYIPVNVNHYLLYSTQNFRKHSPPLQASDIK